MVLDGTLQVSWLLAAREGKMVGSLGREERPLDDAEGRMEELLSMSPAPTLIMLLLAEDISFSLL